MKLAFIIYDGLTTLDFVDMFDPLTRLKTMGFITNLDYDVGDREEEGSPQAVPAESLI